jgi:hypothetical protein
MCFKQGCAAGRLADQWLLKKAGKFLKKPANFLKKASRPAGFFQDFADCPNPGFKPQIA